MAFLRVWKVVEESVGDRDIGLSFSRADYKISRLLETRIPVLLDKLAVLQRQTVSSGRQAPIAFHFVLVRTLLGQDSASEQCRAIRFANRSVSSSDCMASS